MSVSLRPTSVCDTTPLQRLESQSSSSEPSTPNLNDSQGVTNCSVAARIDEGYAAADPAAAALVESHGGASKIDVNLGNCVLNNNNNINSNNKKKRKQQQQQQEGKMEYHSMRRIFLRILLDLSILACVGLPIMGFRLWGEPYKRGFFCDDASLKHPYRDSTVHSWMLYLMGFAVPVALITAVEFFKSHSNKLHRFGNLSMARYLCCHLELPDWLVECYKKIGALIFGAGVCQLTTEIAKYSVGRLRPHFFAVCQPLLYDGSTCADAINAGRYIENFACRHDDDSVSARMLKEVRLSFPSGHANFSCYTMIYIAIYLQARWTWQRSKMLKHMLQFLFLMFAWYTALTRVSDYKHHWTDVLAGSTIGAVYALVVTSSMW